MVKKLLRIKWKWIVILVSINNFLLCHCDETKIHLSSDKRHNVSMRSITPQTYFFVEAYKQPSFIMGSTNIDVCMNKDCDFELEFYKSQDEMMEKLPIWLSTFKKLQFWSSLLFIKRDQLRCRKATGLSPFVNKFFKIKFLSCNEDQVFITLRHKVLDYMCCVYMLLGLLLFLNAPSLSKSVVFYYTGGTALGIIGSALVVVFILSRFLPKKPVAYTAMFGGWSLCAYIFSRFWLNLIDVISQYYLYIIAYVCITGFLTFAYCYYRGPITNPRCHNILQWAIQIIAIVFVYHGTQMPKASMTVILLLLIRHFGILMFRGVSLMNILRKIIPFSNYIFGPRYKPRKLLSEEEYRIQARIETEKALEELRKHCQSPECSPWKTLSKITSPQRFAKFVEGEHHLSAQEITSYEEDMSGVFDQEEVLSGNSFMSEDDDSLDPLNFDTTEIMPCVTD